MKKRINSKFIKKRIKGTLMTNRTRTVPRTSIALLTCLTFVVCFMTACQPTPVTPPVVNKGDDHLEEMIVASTESPLPSITPDPVQSEEEQNEALRQALRERLDAPETYEDSFTNDKGDITVSFDNAQVEVPAVQNVPVVSLKPYAFSQEMVDKYASYFLQGAPVYTQKYERTKEEIEAEIIRARKDLQDAKDEGADNSVMRDYIAQKEQNIEDLEKEYETAPVEREKTAATLEFVQTEYGQVIKVVADLGKEDVAEFSVYNGEQQSDFCFSNYGKWVCAPGYEQITDQIPNGMTMGLDEATELVRQCLDELEIENMQIDGVYYSRYFQVGIGNSNQQGYNFELIRIFRGIPVTRIDAATPNSTDDPNAETPKEPEYTEVVKPEWIFINVDDTGVVGMQWMAPFEEDEVLSENVTLMPFEDIVEKAKENMFFQGYTASNCTCHIHITSIRLGMMRIMRKDKQGEYMMVPVWDFIGNREQTVYDDTSWLPFGDQSYVTINAIDGSHINREWGY